MEIKDNKLKELYSNEDGKLTLDFSQERYEAYVRIIDETNEYRKIIDDIPTDLTTLEKTYYVYNRLGKLLYENNSLVYNHLENLHMYYGTMRDGGVGNCRQMSELFVSMLRCANITNDFFLIRKPVGVEGVDLRHIDAIININGKLYMTDIIRDTVNMRAGIRNMKFGYTDTKEKRQKELKKYISSKKIDDSIQKELIMLIEESDYVGLLELINNYKKDNGIDIGITYFSRKIPKIEYASQIEEQIGTLEHIPQKSDGETISIESLDKRIKNVRDYEDIGFPYNFSLRNYHYFEDILENVLIPQMSNNDSYIRRGWSISSNSIINDSFDQSLEMDVDIILDFFYRVAPEMDSEIKLKYLKFALDKIYSKRDYKSERDSSDWISKNIKLYKTISQHNLETNGEVLPLETLLVIRRKNPINEKYIFYNLRDGKKAEKVPYNEMIDKMKHEKHKICSKFSIEEKNSIVDELEL